ncbi:DUF2283 domain-containing protein [Candidatus Daviesbacteria bacterium]|nr:DUF2283 domain-containing protein [Candidatus Daviesbacteria bacterium]
MKISYDPKADAAYIYFIKDKKSTHTEEVGEGLFVDYYGDDLIGIEILDVSKKLPKNEIKSITAIERVEYPKAVAHKISK